MVPGTRMLVNARQAEAVDSGAHRMWEEAVGGGDHRM
jgi:hypothetical protein